MVSLFCSNHFYQELTPVLCHCYIATRKIRTTITRSTWRLPFGQLIMIHNTKTSSKLEVRGELAYALRPSTESHGYLFYVPNLKEPVDTSNYSICTKPLIGCQYWGDVDIRSSHLGGVNFCLCWNRILFNFDENFSPYNKVGENLSGPTDSKPSVVVPSTRGWWVG